jgi:hypothetical protein
MRLGRHLILAFTIGIGLACVAGGGAPVLQQSNVHFDGCPTTAKGAQTMCRAVATVHNTGGAGGSRQVFYYSLRRSGKT